MSAGKKEGRQALNAITDTTKNAKKRCVTALNGSNQRVFALRADRRKQERGF
jgi:hypothetical protein